MLVPSKINRTTFSKSFNISFQCIISGVKFKPASGNSQKEAKERAGRVVLDHLLGKQYGLEEESEDKATNKVSHRDLAKIALDKLEFLASKNPSFAIELLRQDCAVFVKSKKLHNSHDLEVISLACGSDVKSLNVSGDKKIRNCRAVSLARRGLIRYIQSEMRKYCINPDDSVLELVERDKVLFQLREFHQFHLVLFQPPEIENYQTLEENLPNDPVEDAKFNNYEHPVDFYLLAEDVIFQHDVKEYEKLNHSCNKLFKWNHVGLLGSKMSGYVKTIFLESITAQTSPQLMAYAACCRSKIPIHHPRVGEDDLLYTFARYPKPIPISVHWSKGFKDSHDVEGISSENGQTFNTKSDISLLTNYAFLKRVEKTIESAREKDLYEVYDLLKHPNTVQMKEYRDSIERFKRAVYSM